MTDWFMTSSEVDVFSAVRGATPPRHGLTIPHLCINAGNDIIMPDSPFDRNDIIDCVKNGTLGLAELQNCTSHVLRMIFRTEVYENSRPYYDYVSVEPMYITCE